MREVKSQRTKDAHLLYKHHQLTVILKLKNGTLASKRDLFSLI